MSKQNRSQERQGLTVLTPKDRFRFECGPELECYTRCCRDITIVLTPYDVLCMKNALKISSGEFLDRYTLSVIGDRGLPVVMLKMRTDEEKSCPFVSRKGCAIYADRPWACRIYPLQPESSQITEKAGKQYYSVMDIPFCLGLKSNRSVTLAEWIESQGIGVYQEMEKPFKAITTHPALSQHEITNPRIREMFYMASFDLDRFRRFVLESSFMERFEVDPRVAESLPHDDLALYQFAMRWLEYGLLGQHVLKVRPEVLEAKKKELEIR